MTSSISIEEDIPLVRETDDPEFHLNRSPPHHEHDRGDNLPFDHADHLTLLKTYLDEKFSSFKHHLQSDAESKDSKKKYKYKGKSHKIQGQFNEELLVKVSQARLLLETGSLKRPSRLLTEVEQS